MLFLSSLLNPIEENCVNIVRIFSKQLRVRVSNSGIRKIKEHPSYPSLQSVSDILKEWKVESIGLKIQPKEFSNLPTPFIAQLKENHTEQAFVVVKEYSAESVVISDYLTNKWKTFNREAFQQQATGFVLVAEATENAGEIDYTKNIQKERFQKIVTFAGIAIILFLCILSVIRSFNNYGTAGFVAVCLLLLKIFGLYISALLLWYEIDEHNPTLQEVCKGGKNVNCGAILKSAAAKIFGISWGEIGYFYFIGGLCTLLIGGLSPALAFALTWLNVIALPYLVFSIYYQWRIAKQWCVLCLTVQGILAAEFLISLLGRLHNEISLSAITSADLFTIVLAFILPAIGWFLIKPVLQAAHEKKLSKTQLTRLKYNAEIFNALLEKQKTIEFPSEGLGIIIGPPNAKNKLIKICNPYCGPCAAAHVVIDELLESNDNLQLQIIFTVTNNEKDYRATAAKHLIAIAEKNDTKLIKQALDDWYLAEKKDYEAFAAKYPMNGELKEQGAKIEAMNNWCNQTQVVFTPTIFINNHQLPKDYSVADLKYFLAG